MRPSRPTRTITIPYFLSVVLSIQRALRLLLRNGGSENIHGALDEKRARHKKMKAKTNARNAGHAQRLDSTVLACRFSLVHSLRARFALDFHFTAARPILTYILYYMVFPFVTLPSTLERLFCAPFDQSRAPRPIEMCARCAVWDADQRR